MPTFRVEGLRFDRCRDADERMNAQATISMDSQTDKQTNTSGEQRQVHTAGQPMSKSAPKEW